MGIPTEWLSLEWHSQGNIWTYQQSDFHLNSIPQNLPYTYFIPKFYFTIILLWRKILPFLCMMVLIRHLCEHDTNILFTSAFKMAGLYRFIQICLHGTSKTSIVFSPLLFSGGQSINQSIHEYLLCSEIYAILLCHSSPIIYPNALPTTYCHTKKEREKSCGWMQE